MSKFLSLFYLELKRFCRKRNLVLWAILILLIILFVNKGIDQYKIMPGKVQKFNQIQDSNFDSMRNYNEYAYYGIKMLFIPAPIEILFKNNTMPPDVTARVTSVIIVQIINNLKGKSIYTGFKLGKTDFSRIVLFLISLLVLWYGYESFHTRGYLASLNSRWSDLKVFLSIGISRFILLVAAFVIMAVCILLFMTARGVQLTGSDYNVLSGYLLVTLLMLLFFFIAGLIIGTIQSVLISVSSIFCTLIFMTYIVPGILGSIAGDAFPDSTKNYKTELDKIKTISDFEDRSSKKHGKFDPNDMEKEREIIEDYKKHDFPRIKARELQLMSEIKAAVDRTNKLAILTPTTFYLYTSNEVSSKGYASFLEFYQYVVEMWEKFVYFWIDQVFYKGKVLVNFLKIKGNNNIFKSQGHLPDLFAIGLLYNLGICIILIMACFYRYIKWLHPLPKKVSAFNDLVLDFHPGETHVINVYRQDFIDQFLNRFQGKDRVLKWQVTINGENINGWEKQDFFIIPNIKDVPGDIKVKNLFKLYQSWFKPSPEKTETLLAEIGNQLLEKKFKKLEDIDKARVLLILARMNETKIYILIDFAFGIPGYLWNELPGLVDALMKPDTIIIDIETTNNPWLRTKNHKQIAYINEKYVDVNQRKKQS